MNQKCSTLFFGKAVLVLGLLFSFQVNANNIIPGTVVFSSTTQKMQDLKTALGTGINSQSAIPSAEAYRMVQTLRIYLSPSEIEKIKLKSLFLQNNKLHYVMRIPALESPTPDNKAISLELIRQLNTFSGYTAQPDYEVRANYTPSDPYFSSSSTWGQTYRDLWGLVNINTSDAWDTTMGDGVIVAVLDTGVDYTHPDLDGRVILGWNFVNDSADPMDDHGHGTHVAGTISAIDDGVGIVGVAPQAQILAIKVLGATGGGSITAIANGIRFAADNGAKILNLSLGANIGLSDVPDYLTDAITYADSKGSLLIVAAGNDTMNVLNQTPANDPRVVSVSAFDHLDQIASFSNFGGKITVAAPGGGDEDTDGELYPGNSILSLLSSQASPTLTEYIVDSHYLRIMGTSMAAPHVAGVAALILSDNPTFSVDELRQRIQRGVDDTGDAGFDTLSGYGRINADTAISDVDPFALDISSPIISITGSSMNVPIVGTVTGVGLTSWTLQYGIDSYPSSWTAIDTGAAGITDDTIATWDVTNVSDGLKTLRLTATDGGNTFEYRVQVYVNVHTLNIPTNISITTKDGTTATVTWTTNTPATSQIEYGTTDVLGQATAVDNTLTTDHSHTVSGLSPNTSYYYRVVSTDSDSNTRVSITSTLQTTDQLAITSSLMDSAGTIAVEATSSHPQYGENRVLLVIQDGDGNDIFSTPMFTDGSTGYVIRLPNFTASTNIEPTTTVIRSIYGGETSANIVGSSVLLTSEIPAPPASTPDSGSVGCASIHNSGNTPTQPWLYFFGLTFFILLNVLGGRIWSQQMLKD